MYLHFLETFRWRVFHLYFSELTILVVIKMPSESLKTQYQRDTRQGQLLGNVPRESSSNQR